MKENTGHIAEVLRKFLSGNLTEEEQNQLEEWLNASPQNKQFLESFRQAKNIEEDLFIVRKLDADKAWNKLNHKNRTGIKLIGKWSLGIAASITFLIGCFALWRTEFAANMPKERPVVAVQKQDIAPATSGAILVLADGTKIPLNNDSTKTLTKNNNLVGNSNELIVKGTDQVILVQYNSLIVPKASFYKMTLVDGTKVWVNALSQLKFPAQFSKTERRVFLDGEAYFEVAHNPNQPFIVESKGNEIKVLGTHFNVNSYTEQVRTTLAEGKVEISRNNERVELSPGEYVWSSKDNLIKGKADLQRDLSWHNNEFYFKKETIVDIAHQLSRWYDLDVKFRGNVQLDKEYTGSIERDVKLSQVLEMLSYVSNLKFEVDGKQLIIETKS
ncbi:FecR family protein [Sphingobacterium sp. BIGb0165]|uniref:FecR family protein n=1 Tax=Sphingobacterium sp. BIGb0165 TaxID=2940615 RepID=UPI002167AEFF|nr:FecR family protein [Sphingobacterium sp. BIGb0165]MCS4225151.1 ferric-dicitrate binding protein FerR (iron transport regulator) [Sphingobacterium sp. BIGb0165]